MSTSPSCLTLLMALLGLWACSETPNIDDRTARQIIATKYDPAVDFGSFSTFAVSPNVALVTDAGEARAISTTDSQAVIDSITRNLRARGYRRVEPAAHPDLGAMATAFIKLKVETVAYPGYWSGTPGYPTPPSYWGYPGGSYAAGYGYSSVAYKSGTLIVELVDLRDAGRTPALDGGSALDAGGPRLEVAWAAILHGYVALGGSFLPEVPEAIDQAFVQSPYLQAR
jgi:hypothetical protein